jgi:hypothetical protein
VWDVGGFHYALRHYYAKFAPSALIIIYTDKKNTDFSPLFSVYLRVSSANLRVTVYGYSKATLRSTHFYNFSHDAERDFFRRFGLEFDAHRGVEGL